MNKKSKRIIFLMSHPIQYFTPLFKLFSSNKDFDITVLYCDTYGVNKENLHPEVGKIEGWDIPLLEGYNYKFLKNFSWKPSIFNGFFGLINFEIIKILKNEKGSYLIIQGWNYFTHILAIIFGKLFGLIICIRGDNPYKQELLKNKKLIFIKKIFLSKILFKFFDYCFYVGKQNKLFYEFYGVPDKKLIFTPHAVDNSRFSLEYEILKFSKLETREKLGLPKNKIIILFVGQLISKKRPLDLLKAYDELNRNDLALVYVGDGYMKSDIEKYILNRKLHSVYITGFKNQSEIGKYYACGDLLILPSGLGETWGLVINEAMNFGLPIIASDLVGAVDDLVLNDYNGYVFKAYDINELKYKIELLVDNPKFSEFGNNSKKLITNYSYDNIINTLKKI